MSINHVTSIMPGTLGMRDYVVDNERAQILVTAHRAAVVYFLVQMPFQESRNSLARRLHLQPPCPRA